ncbi:MAG TPA: amino acid ABC transporter permease [Anaerolineales bacterium]|nr:amino acid ABC transporter permease [Anaerolineales bacterium]
MPQASERPIEGASALAPDRRGTVGRRLVDLPWWLFAIIVLILWVGFIILTRPNYTEAFERVSGTYRGLAGMLSAGILVTIGISLASYLIAIVLGLITGLARMSQSLLLQNAARTYIELIRGIPMLVLIFFIALVGVPAVVDLIDSTGEWLISLGLTEIGGALTRVENDSIPMVVRAIIALATTYGAFLAEIFRAGIQSIGKGQMEAARSLGMTYPQAMRYVILPQAVRNILPALGNDFVSMVKDSSLVALLAVRDMTQMTKLYTGQSFRFREGYIVLSILYLALTVTLSLGVQAVERRLRRHE